MACLFGTIAVACLFGTIMRRLLCNSSPGLSHFRFSVFRYQLVKLRITLFMKSRYSLHQTSYPGIISLLTMTGPTDPLSNTAEAQSAANGDPEAALSIGPLADAGTLDSDSEVGDSGSISNFSNFSIDLSVCMNDLGLYLPN